MKAILAAACLAPLVLACVITKSEVHEHNPEQSAQAFEMIKSLAGQWLGSTTGTDRVGEVKLSYELVSGGSVVMERLNAGTPEEMVSMYHLDGDRLLMTHYCVLGNQPRMELVGFTPAPETTATFSFRDATNWKGPKELVMHDVRLCRINSEQLAATWTAWVDDKPDHSANFTFRRIYLLGY